MSVQLWISQLEDSGRRIASLIQPVGDTAPTRGCALFDVRVPDNSPSYWVAVTSFDFEASAVGCCHEGV